MVEDQDRDIHGTIREITILTGVGSATATDSETPSMSPLVRLAVPDLATRAVTSARSTFASDREGTIAFDSSSTTVTGSAPTTVRATATGGPPPVGARANTNTGSLAPSSTARSGARLTSTTMRAKVAALVPLGWLDRLDRLDRAGRFDPGGRCSVSGAAKPGKQLGYDGFFSRPGWLAREQSLPTRDGGVHVSVPGGGEASEPERLLVVGVELEGTIESLQGARRESVPGDARFRFRPVRKERRLVAEKRVGASERGERRGEAFEYHLRAGEQEPPIGVGGVVRKSGGKRGDHRLHRLRRRGPGRRLPGRWLRVESVRRSEPEIERQATDRHHDRDRDRHPVRRRVRSRARRLASPDIGKQSALDILAQRSVPVRLDLAPVTLSVQLRETLAVQGDVRVVHRIATGGRVAHQGRHDQQQRDQNHDASKEPEEEHREPLEMADPRRGRGPRTRNLSGGPCAGKDAVHIHL